VIHVLSVSYKLLTEFTKEVVTKNGVEERLTVEYADYIKNSDFDIVINLLDVTTAHGLNHYFINQKRILAGYPKFGETVELTREKSRPTDSIERKMLLFPGSYVLLSTLSKKHICTKLEFDKIGKKLQKLNLGTLGKKKITSKESLCFFKADPEKNNSMEFINNLLDFFIDLDDYIKFYNSTVE
jgi:hypothetical protein